MKYCNTLLVEYIFILEAVCYKRRLPLSRRLTEKMASKPERCMFTVDDIRFQGRQPQIFLGQVSSDPSVKCNPVRLGRVGFEPSIYES